MFSEDHVKELFRRTIYSEYEKPIKEKEAQCKAAQKKLEVLLNEMKEKRRSKQGKEDGDDEGDQDDEEDAVPQPAPTQDELEAEILENDPLVEQLGRFLQTVGGVLSKVEPFFQLKKYLDMSSSSSKSVAEKMVKQMNDSNAWPTDFVVAFWNLVEGPIVAHVPLVFETIPEAGQFCGTVLVDIYKAQQAALAAFPFMKRPLKLLEAGDVLTRLATSTSGAAALVWTPAVVDSIILPAFVPRGIRQPQSVALSNSGGGSSFDFSSPQDWSVVHFCFWHQLNFKRQLLTQCLDFGGALDTLDVVDRLTDIKQSGASLRHAGLDQVGSLVSASDGKAATVVSSPVLDLASELLGWFPDPTTLLTQSPPQQSWGCSIALVVAAALGLCVDTSDVDGGVLLPPSLDAVTLQERAVQVATVLKGEFFSPLLASVEADLLSPTSPLGSDSSRVVYLLLYLPLRRQVEWFERAVVNEVTPKAGMSGAAMELEDLLDILATGSYRLLAAIEASASRISSHAAPGGMRKANGKKAAGGMVSVQSRAEVENQMLEELLDPEGKPKLNLHQVEAMVEKRSCVVQAQPAARGPQGQTLHAVLNPVAALFSGDEGSKPLAVFYLDRGVMFLRKGSGGPGGASYAAGKFKEVLRLSDFTDLLA